MNLYFDRLKGNLQAAVSIEFRSIAFIFFFFPFILKMFWPAYLFVGLHTIFKLKFDYLKNEQLVISLSAAFLLLKFVQAPSIQALKFYKTFIGLYAFYFYFKYINRIKFEKTLMFFSSLLFFSEFSLNIFNNIPQFGRRVFAIAYPRPIGIGGNATITSIIFITFLLYYYLRLKKLKPILVFDLLICGSGTGYLGLIYVFITKKMKPKLNLKNIILLLSILTLYFGFYYLIKNLLYTGNPVYKMSPWYFYDLFHLKISDFRNIIYSYSLQTHLFGLSWKDNLLLGGDFGWRDVYQMCGISGILYYLFLIHKICGLKEIKFIIIISMFHYGIIWWPAGQIFTGYLFAQMGEQSESF